MATFKAVVSNYKRADGTYNIKIRVTQGRNAKFLSTQWYVTSKDLTGKGELKTQSFKDAAEDLIRKYRRRCNELGERLKNMTVDNVIEYIEKDAPENFKLNFIEFGRGVVAKLRETGHEGNARTYAVALNALERFAGGDQIDICEITGKYVERFLQWIDDQPAPPKRTKSGRAASLYYANIRSLHNMAKREHNDEDLGIIRIPLSPFAKVKAPPVPESRKRALPIETLRAIAALPDRPIRINQMNPFNLARDVFTLSFFLVGINTIDLWAQKNMHIKDGRLIYERIKTTGRRRDKARISIKIEPEAAALIEKYRGKAGGKVFIFDQAYSSANSFNRSVNRGLKSIGAEVGVDDLEFYAARHSWATIARNKCGVSKDDVDFALNHVDPRAKLADIYIDEDWGLIDVANRKVLDLFSAKPSEQ